MPKIIENFLDSGAFSLKTKAEHYAKNTGKNIWFFYETEDFWSYMDKYVLFIQTYHKAIDLYANIDVIGNPELTWRNQQWLEQKGLHPIPVIHFMSDPKLYWLKHYIKNKYLIIGLGGLAYRTRNKEKKKWLDDCFNYICNTKNRLPSVKIHGFGVTGFNQMIRYPWWSVDSTTWIKRGAFGEILVPKKTKKEKFAFDRSPYLIGVSSKYPNKRKIKHNKNDPVLFSFPHSLSSFPSFIKEHVYNWLTAIHVDINKIENDTNERTKANIRFFEQLEKNYKKWPRPFLLNKKRNILK